jgi:hypothetical protein
MTPIKKRLIAGAMFLATVSSLATGSVHASPGSARFQPWTVYVESPRKPGYYTAITIGEPGKPVTIHHTDHK